MTCNLDHILSCARRGASSGASENEKHARAIVQALLDGVIGLDENAVNGIGELVKQLYRKRLELSIR
ncbi:MAG TPA: hypothetical protein DDW52_23125 [Planctomycetaceae bacterium]|nr:hypothetical protein [Planctomycetaceae bacterium]